jgi:hypothetical protein
MASTLTIIPLIQLNNIFIDLTPKRTSMQMSTNEIPSKTPVNIRTYETELLSVLSIKDINQWNCLKSENK